LIMSRKNPPNTKYAAWMVSNCDKTGGASKRWEYVQALIRAGLKLDGYGECFDNLLKEKPWSTSVEKPTPFAPYKFYLAFENSIHCNGYISEKMWRNSLAQGLVPVIYGPHPDDVKAQAPPNSYIHVEDFDSPKALTEYLDYLDQNATAYAEYHDWRKLELDQAKPVWSASESMKCGVCNEIKRRKAAGYPKRTISSVANWWWINVHDDECTSGAHLADWVTGMKTVTMKNQYDEERHGPDGQNKHNWYPAAPKAKKGKELRKEMKEQDKSNKHHKDHHNRHHNRKTAKLEENTKPKRK